MKNYNLRKLNLSLITGGLIAMASPLLANSYYVFDFKTADLTGAGTDSNIYLILEGMEGESKKIRVQDYADGSWEEEDDGAWDRDTSILERNSHTGFTMTGKQLGGDIGPITGVRLQSDGKYSGSEWDLEYITIDFFDAKTSTVRNAVREPFGKHLSDRKTRRALEDSRVRSTFKYTEGITGDEISGDNGKPGILLAREEKAAIPSSNEKTVGAAIYTVQATNAFGAATPAERNNTVTTVIVQSFSVSEELVDAFGISNSLEVGYAPSDAVGGGNVSNTLTLEYESIKGNTTTKGSESKIENAEATVTSVPVDHYSFRIIRTPGKAKMRKYRSTLSLQEFASQYVFSTGTASELTQVDFKKGVADDAKWNSQVAKPLATLGNEEFDRHRKILMDNGCLTNKAKTFSAVNK